VSPNFTFLAVGDVAPCRERPAEMFDGVRDLLRSGDLVFGQLETNITKRGSPAANAKLAMRTDPAAVPSIVDAGFHVMSFAGNHCLDWGREGLADTLEHMAATPIAVCGAGPNIAAARRPAIVEVQGTRVAFLAYSSILPAGYWAEHDRPGCAPMRALTLYQQVEVDQPGTPAKVHTYPDRADLTALRADVRRAKQEADLVAVSLHWGIHFVPSEIADYQRDVAHAAIDDGACAVLGHHPHILKGVEIYKGAPIFYSLGNFAIEQPQAFDPSILNSSSFKELMELNPNIDPMRMFVGPPDSQKTLVAKLTVEGGRIVRTAFVPAQIADTSEPTALTPDDPRFAEIGAYVDQISHEQNLGVTVRADGGEFVVEARA
jgi:poly-gamma-glutamate synthesis protein (capsule biosynthesis protein)